MTLKTKVKIDSFSHLDTLWRTSFQPASHLSTANTALMHCVHHTCKKNEKETKNRKDVQAARITIHEYLNKHIKNRSHRAHVRFWRRSFGYFPTWWNTAGRLHSSSRRHPLQPRRRSPVDYHEHRSCCWNCLNRRAFDHSAIRPPAVKACQTLISSVITHLWNKKSQRQNCDKFNHLQNRKIEGLRERTE